MTWEWVGDLTSNPAAIGFAAGALGLWAGRRPARATAAESIERAAVGLTEGMRNDLERMRADLTGMRETLAVKDAELEEALREISRLKSDRLATDQHIHELTQRMDVMARESARVAGFLRELHSYAQARAAQVIDLGGVPGDVPVHPLTRATDV